MRSGNAVIVAMITVVTSFALSLAYSQYVLQRIDRRALAISNGSVPRFESISETRRQLQETTTLTHDYVHREGLGYRRKIDDSLARLRADIAVYGDIPDLSEEERRLLARVRNDIDVLNAAVRATLDEVDAGEQTAALQNLIRSAQPQLDGIDNALKRLRSLSEEQIKGEMGNILSARRRGREVATISGLLSLATAIAATALVLHGQRSRTRLAAEHDRMLTERAAELEAFAGRVAHDLRDPLHAASLRQAALLKAEVLDPQLRGYVVSASRQLDRMRRIIDGLLDFARSGAQPDSDAQVDLTAVLDEVIASARPAAEAAQAELRITVPLEETRLAVAPEALASVIANLVSNATKYVVEGERLPHRIDVRVSRGSRLARIEVEDNGPGLPLGAEYWIFEPFRRLPSKQPGIGLGLATVKRIVEAYQGRVGVSVVPGRGSIFWVELPLSNAASPAATGGA
jgi:signal transduction histidine kinase